MTPAQCRQALALQRQGLTLREIAAEIGASRDEVTLYLFGGIADWQPRIGTPAVAEGEARSGADPDAIETNTTAPKPLPADAVEDQRPAEAKTVEQAPSEPEGAAGVQDRCESTPAPIPPETVQTGVETSDATASQAGGGAVASPADLPERFEPPAPRAFYILRSADGQYLHQNERTLTRLPRFYWEGTAADYERLFRRRPEWVELDPIPTASPAGSRAGVPGAVAEPHRGAAERGGR